MNEELNRLLSLELMNEADRMRAEASKRLREARDKSAQVLGMKAAAQLTWYASKGTPGVPQADLTGCARLYLGQGAVGGGRVVFFRRCGEQGGSRTIESLLGLAKVLDDPCVCEEGS